MSTRPLSQTSPRPFLKWAGGKSKLIPQYRPYLPQEFVNYFEPFLGGGALFFALLPKSAYLGDINGNLINLYTCIRDDVEVLITSLKVHQANHKKDYYYQIRAANPDNKIERASRLLYLNKTCFNGLYRENSKGQFNVPIGSYKNPKICDPNLLRHSSQALANKHIANYSFERVLDEARGYQDFVYFDPPYYPLNPTSNFTSYSRHSFGEKEQIKLQEVFTQLANRGVQVMLSNSDCSFIRDLYQDYQIREILAARAINSKAERRGRIKELLITSY